jgi:hypothetical protein
VDVRGREARFVGTWIPIVVGVLALAGSAAGETRQLLWGDTHLHSSNSFDAFLNRNMSADPDTAYRYAKGLPVIHPFHRARVQIETPLDFLVIADHAELLGVIRHTVQREIPEEGLSFWQRARAAIAQRRVRRAVEKDEGAALFLSFLPTPSSVEEAAANPRELDYPGSDTMSRTIWQEAIAIADVHDEPGVFTTLIGWEWSSIPAGANLHRVVFTSADANTAARFQPYSSIQSMYPEDLWAWLDETSRETGAEFVAIPHNSNISKGYMFAETSLRGEPYTAESARTRARWEPVVEATQIKGDSETHPAFSPGDPFADFETYPHYIQNDPPPYDPKPGDYVRAALRRGLEIEARVGANPYRFGLIGSTDSHTGVASAEEPNFWGKMARDSTPETKQAGWRGKSGPTGWSMSASGLAAVWAEGNTRDAILEAFRRREVYATSGPRIAVRVFGGWDYEASDAKASAIEEVGYARGVPMGSALPAAPKGGAPRFLIHAQRDPKSANLDRVQIVKGWIDGEGRSHEEVIDVVWSDDRVRDADGILPPVGNTVDLATAGYSNEIGAPTLSAVWRDPAFDPTRSAFYYVRVLEIPTPRHALFDAIALGLDPSELEGPATLQERAYTSPIWYAP